MIKGRLIKIDSTHSNLRTDKIDGYYLDKPVEGLSFKFYSKPLNSNADMRIITTTPIKKVLESNNLIEFKTKNSLYRLELNEDN